MVGIGSLIVNVYLVVLLTFRLNSAEGDEKLVTTCKTNGEKEISAWDWEIINGKNETYFINFCHGAKNCGKDISVCKKSQNAKSANYGSTVTGVIPTKPYGKNNESFTITFNGTVISKPGCANKMIQTIVNFQCDKTLGSPEFVDDDGCIVIIDFFTKEACTSYETNILEIPCVIYNPKDKKKRDLSPLIKIDGAHRVSSVNHGVKIFINVCRDIFDTGTVVPANSCSDKGNNFSPACRKDANKPIGKITKESKLFYDGDKIKLVYNYTVTAAKNCTSGVITEITFLCQQHSSDGGTGPVLVSETQCRYDIMWKTDHACPNNDVITDKCQFTNGEVSFDLTMLEKPKKELSYGVEAKQGETLYEYRIKVCNNGQPCGTGNDEYADGSKTAVCQISRNTSKAYSCGSAEDRTIRYADGILTMVYKGGSPCSNNIHRRTIITFQCDPAGGLGSPTFVEEQHCYYYFNWKTKHVCPSRKPGACSVISESGDTYDLSILTKLNTGWLAVGDSKKASGSTFYMNVCGSLASLPYKKCHESAACEVKKDGTALGIGMFKRGPTIKDKYLSLVYIGDKCGSFEKNITTTIKFVCKNKDLESPPELESNSWDGCDYVFTWATAAACSLQVVSGQGCFLEDTVTGNVYDLSPLSTTNDGKNYYNITTKNTGTFYVKMCSNNGLDRDVCGNRGDKDTGMCQKTAKEEFFIVGKVHDSLSFYDGVLKLQFRDGKQCNNQKKRQSHITFFCDESVGSGTPVFVSESSHCVYNFVWYTKYACPLKTMECAVRDSKTHREYDLSPLVKTNDNWVVMKDGRTYYINICRVLHRTKDTSGCPAKSSVCMKLKNATEVSIGEIVEDSKLTVKKDGLIVLQYNYKSKSKQYYTMIYFRCDKEGKVGEPTLDTHGDAGGGYTFEWKTKEACEVKASSEPGCDDKHTLISGLKRDKEEFYTVTLPKRGKIIFDICQNVTCGNKQSAACWINKKKKSISVGELWGSRVEHDLDVTILTYPGSAWDFKKSFVRPYETRINFVCAYNATEGKPKFIAQDENVFRIEFKTSAVCKSVDLQCEVNSPDGKHYDLSPLTLSSGNWMAKDTRSHLVYYINVCREYFPGTSKTQCQGSAGIATCQVDTNANTPHDAGHVTGGPIISSAQHLTLVYNYGQLCHSKYHRSTRINFFCSDVHGSPVYMAETEDCEYVFNWKTPSACPVVDHIGKNCVVYDNTNGFYYDLNPLKGVYTCHDGDTNKNYNVGFCKAQPDECVKNDSCFVNEGSATEKLNLVEMKYYDGNVIFTHSNKNLNVSNEISCDPKAEKLSATGMTNSSSSYHIFWKSKLVCPPVTGEECSITHDGSLYDLSVLAKEDWNWVGRNILDDEDENKDKNKEKLSDYQFYFSVCKPLYVKNIPGLRNNGSRGAMINKQGKVISLGTMIERLSFSGGYLTMKYGQADPVPSLHCTPSTTIQFVCDGIVPEGVGVGPVVDGFDTKRCHFHVTWPTRAACGVGSLPTASVRTQAPCTAVHPATRKVIDLRSLNTTAGTKIVDKDNNEYWINVCGTPNVCKDKKSGICKKNVKTYTSVGKFSTTLVYRQGFLSLLYKDGGPCESDKSRKTETLISFVCDPKSEKSDPILEKTGDCTHFVTWKTKLACEAEVDCVAHNGKDFYDLTPLINNDANYEVEHEGNVYLINVCRSLVSDSRCPSDATVCRVKDSENFGVVDSPPKLISEVSEPNVKAQLVYKNGKCKGLGKTTIDFTCNDENQQEGPNIVHADECSMKILWSTSLVCEKKLKEESCTIRDDKNHYCFDLTKLGAHKVKFLDGEVHFHVCGRPSDDCEKKSNNSEACLTTGSQSATAQQRDKVIYNGQEVTITYDDVVLILYCGENGNSNTPQYIGQHKGKNYNQMKYFFNLITPEVCPPSKPSCEVTHNGKRYNLAGLSENMYHVKDKDDEYWISVCSHIKYTPQTKICSSRATAIRISGKKRERQVIGVDTGYSITYKENFIHLEYSGGDKSARCQGRETKVSHKLKCDRKGVSPPKFDGFDKTSCTYSFIWVTSDACAEKSSPLTQIGDDWIFRDLKVSGCELDLSFLKNTLSKTYGDKDCNLGKKVEVYDFGERYELLVNCTSSGKVRKIDVSLKCGNNTEPMQIGSSDSWQWDSSSFCETTSPNCDSGLDRSVAKSALAVIGTLTGIGFLAAIIFFACKPEKRKTTAMWLRWHIRKYICCKRSYQASYRYKKVNTDEDGETGFIVETGAGSSLFSDDDTSDDNHNSDEKDDDDDLLPLDDDLLNLE